MHLLQFTAALKAKLINKFGVWFKKHGPFLSPYDWSVPRFSTVQYKGWNQQRLRRVLLLKLKYREGVEHKGWKQQRLRRCAIAQAEIPRRRRAQRMETAKINTSAIAQAEIQRRRRAQRMETAKIKTSTTARQRSLCSM